MIEKGKLYERDVKMYTERPANVYEMLVHSVEKFPTQEALIKGENRLTYRELKTKVDTVASNLLDMKMKKGDRIAILLENEIEFVFTALACAKIGAIFIPLNTKLIRSELIYLLTDSAPKLLITSYKHIKHAENWVLESEFIQTCILIDNHSPIKGMDSFKNTLLKTTSKSTLNYTEPKETDPLYIMYTSGTTGLPKGAICSHTNVIHSCLNYKYVLQTKGNDRTIIVVPLFHVTSLVGQLLHMILIGGTSFLMGRYSTKHYLELITSEAATFLFNVPKVYIDMIRHPLFKTLNYDCVRIAAYGGAPISKQTIEQLKSHFPNTSFHNVYGATETTSPTTIMPKVYPDEKTSSVGLPVPVADLMIVNQNGEPCGPTEMGELYIKGPMVIKEYWKNEKENSSSFYEGYWKSGDIVYIDQDGFVYIMDRIKDMINRGGEKIYTLEIENILNSHPKVLEASVVGIHDDLFGEEVKAYIVKKPGEKLTKEEVLIFARKHLSEYKLPRYIEFIKELHRNPGGKILKKELVELSKMKNKS